MEYICSSCFVKPVEHAVGASERTVVCPGGDLVPGRPRAESLQCDRCGHPIHFDGVTRAWYAH